MRRSLLTSAVLTTAGALALVVAPPASAAGSVQSFSLRTAGAGTYWGDGYAVSSGQVTFYSGVNRVLVNASINDVCQSGTTGDGYAARLILAVVYTDGYKTSNIVGTDDQGCSKSAVSVTLNQSYPKRVRKVQLILTEANLQTGGSGDAALSAWKDNPYT